MLHYWLSVFIKTFWDSVDFIGQSKTGIGFACLVLVITAVWLVRKHGWSQAMKHWMRTAGEGLVITLVAFLIVCFLHFLFEPYHLQHDEEIRVSLAKRESVEMEREWDRCAWNLESETQKYGLLQSNLVSRESLDNSQQAMLNSQQAAINSCVVSLGKMNPAVNTNVKVLVFSVGDQSIGNTLLTRKTIHVSAFVITTNRTMEPNSPWCKSRFASKNI